ncbi:FtsK/SpoIIIE domain-containing protein [Paenibacillus sinopodophylli]|uniref:FtsK/SpoIIIE domain-containing protein n=1 Tax=Paenibacillus sinopodophylli TaxID=1837342 RepID=UPI00110CC60D|nr:FtsK/SpoIIIE domain-containing protein [Paenibacillus sinopodophylli]
MEGGGKGKSGEKESFAQYLTRICGITVAVCIGLQFLDVPDVISQFALQLIRYVALLFGVFVLLPAALQYVWRNRLKWMNRFREWRQQERPIMMAVSASKEQLEAQAVGVYPVSTTPVVSAPSGPVIKGQLSAPYSLLPVNPKPHSTSNLQVEGAGQLISDALQLAGIPLEGEIDILSVESGPTLQTISFQLPPKVQLSKLISKKDDIANHIGHHRGFDVTSAPKFRSAAAFVVPQADRAFVYMRDMAEELQAFADTAALPVIFGSDILGKPMIFDLARTPHLLVAGATGSGKSVFINTMINSLILTRSPKQVKFLLIDPKQVEFTIYRGLPHLLGAPVSDMRKAMLALNKVIVEMEQRYEKFAQSDVRNIKAYNVKNKHDMLPYIVVIIDEYADLMLVSGDEVEDGVQRITQMARAAGIHLVLGTQRPSVNVVTGVIKANLPSRVAFQLQSAVDYRTVLDRGAPPLLGFGDGICMLQGASLQRFQSAATSADDIEATDLIGALKDYWSTDTSKEHDWPSQAEEDKPSAASEDQDPPWEKEDQKEDSSDTEHEETEEHDHPSDSSLSEYDQVLAVVLAHGGFSMEVVQRKLKISYAAATKHVERMLSSGIIGPIDPVRKMRPLILDDQAQHELEQAETLQKMKRYICEYRSAKSSELREVFSIRKEKVLEYMQQLVDEGFLNPPENSRAGYTLAWSEEQMQAFLENN